MSWAVMALGLRLTGVVDRVEGEHAVVCWDADRTSPIPLARLPDVAEGDGLVVRLRPARRGLRAAPDGTLRDAAGAVSVPARLVPGRAYRLHFRTRSVRPPRRPRAAPLPDVFDLSRAGASPHSHRSPT